MIREDIVLRAGPTRLHPVPFCIFVNVNVDSSLRVKRRLTGRLKNNNNKTDKMMFGRDECKLAPKFKE